MNRRDYASVVLDFLDQGLRRTAAAATAVDRWMLGHLTDTLTDVVLPAVDRVYQRGLRALRSGRRNGRR